MSFSLYDTQQGSTMHLASVGGMHDLLQFVTRVIKQGPLKEFIATGETGDVKGVISDIVQYIPYCTNPNVKHTLEHLKEGLETVKGNARVIE
jgi:hypothetical protein